MSAHCIVGRRAVQENGFTGPLPIGRSNRQLSVLRARLNDFSGTIPLEVWELPQLMTFDVTNNRWALEMQNSLIVARIGLSVQAGWQKKQPHRTVSVRCVNDCCLRVGNSYVRRGVGRAQCAAHQHTFKNAERLQRHHPLGGVGAAAADDLGRNKQQVKG
jgi:hypothetical protein